MECKEKHKGCIHDESVALKQDTPIETPIRLNLQTKSNKHQKQSKSNPTKNSYQVHKLTLLQYHKNT
jgi:hypothetical protein